MTITLDSPLLERDSGEPDWAIVAERYTLGVDQWPFERVPVLRPEDV